jgi:Fe-S-cluster containining protein
MTVPMSVASRTNRSLRIAVVGASPCADCTANCCRQNGHDFAVLLAADEHRRFAPFATTAVFQRTDGQRAIERVLPYTPDGRCQFLGPDDRCTIYDDRPAACRAFECAPFYNAEGIGHHARFLRLNPDVAARLERM